MKTLLGKTMLLCTLAVLPGCLAINAALGVMGLIGPPAVQLAGVAYTVSEYSYEYAANDRTPDMVLTAKFDWLIPHEEDPNISDYAGAFREAMITPPSRDTLLAQTEPVVPQPVVQPQAAAEALRPIQAASFRPKLRKEPARIMAPRQKNTRDTPQEKDRIVTASLPVNTPTHTYVDRTVDPLLVRLNRHENALRQAESMISSGSENGVRLSVSAPADNPSEQGINGTWSIRHRLMKTVPKAVHADRPMADHSPGATHGSLNT